MLVRFRYAVVGAWVAIALACALLLPNVEQAETGSLGDLVANDAEAIDTETRSVELFRFPLLSRTVVVERRPRGLTRAQVAGIFARSVELDLGRLPGSRDSRSRCRHRRAARSRPPRRAMAALTYLFFPATSARSGAPAWRNG